uniref:C2H2-type domain-containing protein n=1 Tax=Trichobilharzia regenti TaxID=157069 RepID=A0AA85JYC4_TRIRE|nr:unnamed protein product [Trichobilharzia regenti]
MVSNRVLFYPLGVDSEVLRLQNENESLKRSLKHMENVMKGKEMEINGLRRQVQSFSSGGAMCTVCSRKTNVTVDSGAGRCITKSILNHKRPHLNTSASDGASVLTSSSSAKQPINKRPCVQDSVTDSIPDDRVGTTPTGTRKSPSGESQHDETSDTESTTLTNSVFPVDSLSPPSEIYDASLAIKNAINHNDLVDYDATCQDSSVQDQLQLPKKRNVHQFLYNRRNRPVGAASAPRKITNKLLTSGFNSDVRRYKAEDKHRPSCHHFRPTAPTKPRSDDTGDDVSSPSGFLEAETIPLPVSVTSEYPKNLKLKIHLPSIGGSPTRDDADFKCPLPPECRNPADNILHSSTNIHAKVNADHIIPEEADANKENIKKNIFTCDHCDRVYKRRTSLHRHQNEAHLKDDKVRAKKSFNNRCPSTPTGFWDLDLEQCESNDNVDEKENTKDIDKNGVEDTSHYGLRRRRHPLSFRSIQRDM